MAAPVQASSGLDLTPTMPLDKLGKADILFVCGGVNVREAVTAPLLTALHRLADRGIGLGALCTGGYALARAGLLDNSRATIHWENLSALREEFPRVQLSDQVFSIDRDRYTCSGGTAPLDLMLNLIQLKLGPRVSQLVSEQFVLERVRNDQDRQYIPLRAQIGVSHRSLIKVAELMEENIETPLSLDKIARATGLSRRQIERLFKRHLNCVPKRYYLEMRLRRARELLLQTAMPIMDITTVLRLPVTAPLLQVLPQSVRASPERGAPDPQSAWRRSALNMPVPASHFPGRMSSMDMRLSRSGQSACQGCRLTFFSTGIAEIT